MLSEPIAYLNGEFLPASQAVIPVTDLGFMQGVTAAEQLRTFGGKLFRLDKHLDRLQRSLEIIGVDPELSRDDLTRIAEQLVARNYPALPTGSDLGLSMFVTPGPYATFAASGYVWRCGPTVGMHTYQLPFHLWASKYQTGESLVVTPIEQVPPTSIPAELKCRSRMHYYLADRAARAIEPGARALMVDRGGLATESSTANLLIYWKGEGLVSPPRDKILPGVTVGVIEELALQLDISFSCRPLTVADVARAEEALLCSTSPCVWSVTRLNGQPIADGRPGEIAARLQRAWSNMVGLDIVAQAMQFQVA
jgi:branched-subunit amino acid aminotransferase/4-amino-4-deoxychorismate lyase